MSGSTRAMSFMPIAQRLADRGENGRAIVTVINALRYNPQFFEATPSPIAFIAKYYVPGFEEELNRLQTIYPRFGELLSQALCVEGKQETAHYLQRHFEAYCVNQMKMAHANYGDHTRRQPSPAQESPHPMPYPVGTRLEREAYHVVGEPHRLTGAAQMPRASSSFRRIAKAPSSDNYVGVTRTPQSTQTVSDPLTHADRSLMMALETGIPEVPSTAVRPMATSMEFDGVRIPLTNDDHVDSDARIASMASLELPVKLPPAAEREVPVSRPQPPRPAPMTVVTPHPVAPPAPAEPGLSLDTDLISQIALTSVARRRSKPIKPIEEPVVHSRFERMSATSALSEQPQEVFVEDSMQRVILDFDDQIGSSLMSGGHQASKELTPYRTFDQELAEFLASPLNASNISINVVYEDPFDKVAAVSHALEDEVPQDAPYEPTPSKTFSISSRQLSICVAICVILVLGLITWKASEPDLAKEAIREMSVAYFSAAQAGSEDPVHVLTTNEAVLAKPFTDAFRKFFEVWQSIYFTVSEDAIFVETIDPSQPCEVAAKMLWLTHHERGAEARSLFDATTTDTWRGAEYFKRF